MMLVAVKREDMFVKLKLKNSIPSRRVVTGKNVKSIKLYQSMDLLVNRWLGKLTVAITLLMFLNHSLRQKNIVKILAQIYSEMYTYYLSMIGLKKT